MVYGLTVIVAAGILAALFLYFALNINKEENPFIHILAIGFFLCSLIVIGQASINYKNQCEIVKLNETVAGVTTTFEYGQYCAPEVSTAPRNILFLSLTFFFLTLAYLGIVMLKMLWGWMIRLR